MDKALNFIDNLSNTINEYADKIPDNSKTVEVKEFQEINDDRYAAIEAAKEEDICPPPLPVQKNWYIAVNGQQEGPYEISAIKNLVTERNINKMNCYVWKKGMANWSLMSEVDEFEDKKNTINYTFGSNDGEQITAPISEKVIITCKYCSQKMRVPKKTGRITVTCPSCHKEFPYIS